MYVAEAIAEVYVSNEWPIERIKLAHDRHIHQKGADEDGLYFQCLGCPDCPICRCPVPLENHETDSYWLE